MSVIRKMRRQAAVYWAPLGLDAYGRPGLALPVQLSCRWDDVMEEYLDKDGNTQISNAIVYPEIAPLLGGVLWKGLLSQLTDTVNPFNNLGAWVINKVQQIPNFRNTEVLNMVHVGEGKK